MTTFELQALLRSSVPLELAERRQWVCWKWIQRPKEAKRTKIPVQPSAAAASSTDPETWSTFAEALAGIGKFGIVGIGYVFREDDEFLGEDFDDCLNSDTGEVRPDVADLVRARIECGAYAEISPSGTGVKVISRGKKPGHRCKHSGRKIEMYGWGRFFTTTGRLYPGTPAGISKLGNCQELISELYAELFPLKPQAPRRVTTSALANLDDQTLLERMFNSKSGSAIRALWGGDTSLNHDDDSSADLALCNHLAWWTGGDRQQTDRLFRDSGLYRDKWDEHRGARTYGQMTVEKACGEMTDGGYPAALGQRQAEAASAIRDKRITAPPKLAEAAREAPPVRSAFCEPTEAEIEALAADLLSQAKAQDSADAVFLSAEKLARLSAAAYGSIKGQLKEALGKKLNLNDLEAAVKEARKNLRRKRWKQRGQNGDQALPRIVIGDRQLVDMVNDAFTAIKAANDPPSIFVRAAEPVRVMNDEQGRTAIYHLDVPGMQLALSERADFWRETPEGEYQITPPQELARGVLADRPALVEHLPALEAITAIPTLRPDGTINDAPGYDPATRLYYLPTPGLSVPEIPKEPTPADVTAAREILEYMVCDFPFVADDRHQPGRSASKANYFGLLLTPVIRPALRISDVLLGLIDSPKQGNGKGLLADLVSIAATGSPEGVTTCPTSNEEWKKLITSLLIEGSPVIVFDNVTKTFGSDALASVVSQPVWKDRLMGGNAMRAIPQRATWIATGNNVQLNPDMATRCFRIRIDAEIASPHERTDFQIENLKVWAQENRGAILWALLVMARSWFADGCPAAKVPTVRGATPWAKMVGGILEHAGIGGFLGNQHELYRDLDEESAEWTVFLQHLETLFESDSWTAAEYTQRIKDAPEYAYCLPGKLADDFAKPGASFVKCLGRALRSKIGTRFGEDQLRIETFDKPSPKHATPWRVARG